MLEQSKVQVGVVGLGTVGKRVADAVRSQPDMELVGVALVRPGLGLSQCVEAGVPTYALGGRAPFLQAGVDCVGDLQDLLKRLDVVIDCGPRGSAGERAETYAQAGVRVVYQGGEQAGVAEADFCASANYDDLLGRRTGRVVSCNTTGLVRIISALRQVGAIRAVRTVLVRCGADPDKAHKGSPNALIAHMGFSHHGADVGAFWPELPIWSLASYAPTNRTHLANLFFEFEDDVDLAAAKRALAARRRIVLLEGAEGSTLDPRLHAGSGPRQDAFSAVVWSEGMAARRRELGLSAAIHMESIVVPDTVDLVRALTGTVTEGEISMAATDEALGVRSGHIKARSKAAQW